MAWHSADWMWLLFKVFKFVVTIIGEASAYEDGNGGGVLKEAANHERDRFKTDASA